MFQFSGSYDCWNTTVIEFYPFTTTTLTDDISKYWSVVLFDHKVKYYLVLYVDNIRRIHYLPLGHD